MTARYSPQVLLSPASRAAARLPPMAYEARLSWLETVAEVEGFELTPLTDVVGGGGGGGGGGAAGGGGGGGGGAAGGEAGTRIVCHVGSREAGDVTEAEMLREAAAERRRRRGGSGGSGGSGGGGGGSGGSGDGGGGGGGAATLTLAMPTARGGWVGN